MPVDELRIAAGTGRYVRPVAIFGSNRRPGRRRGLVPLAAARISRFPGSSSAPIAIGARHRYIRIEVENGDDPPLRGIEVSAWSRSRAVRGRLGPERESRSFVPPPDTRSFAARNPGLVTAALALGAVGLLVLRGRR